MLKNQDTAEKKIFGKFRVIRGSHSEGGRLYRKGDIVESTTDLLKHNKTGLAKKFDSADDVVPSATVVGSPDDDGLNDMSIEELRSYAEEGEVDLKGCGNDKKKIIERLRDSGTV